MIARQRRLRRARKEMDAATTYQQWKEAALAHDEASLASEWRKEDESPHYYAPELRKDIQKLQQLLSDQNITRLLEVLHASLHRHHNDLLEPALYSTALAGTKHIVSEYLDTVESVIQALVYMTSRLVHSEVGRVSCVRTPMWAVRRCYSRGSHVRVLSSRCRSSLVESAPAPRGA